ncbi:uncharacterized protein B0H18DRAFT_951562 [Fomitopsis serialis]|uniref:uncharacterized protein n=1 Tax=Fomitopsis serialis TaxID=139415 RepID=UPI002007990C|nr:uncharacterized protein B0H18DRAFT_951562 [Neoantrodia serialis]KAH9934187.1 hypothetical protein B0H18DRAFT_951562 [Neoantrodia serialis]
MRDVDLGLGEEFETGGVLVGEGNRRLGRGKVYIVRTAPGTARKHNEWRTAVDIPQRRFRRYERFVRAYGLGRCCTRMVHGSAEATTQVRGARRSDWDDSHTEWSWPECARIPPLSSGSDEAPGVSLDKSDSRAREINPPSICGGATVVAMLPVWRAGVVWYQVMETTRLFGGSWHASDSGCAASSAAVMHSRIMIMTGTREGGAIQSVQSNEWAVRCLRAWQSGEQERREQRVVPMYAPSLRLGVDCVPRGTLRTTLDRSDCVGVNADCRPAVTGENMNDVEGESLEVKSDNRTGGEGAARPGLNHCANNVVSLPTQSAVAAT